MDAFQEVELIGAALQGVLLDFKLWSDVGVEAQALLLEGVSSVVRAVYGLFYFRLFFRFWFPAQLVRGYTFYPQ